jgi:hypothetical protein
MITYLSINMNVASITNRIKIDMVEINILYPDTWCVGKNLEQTFSHWSNKFKIQIVSPFESGYLDSVNYKKLEEYQLTFHVQQAPYFENAYQNQSLANL